MGSIADAVIFNKTSLNVDTVPGYFVAEILGGPHFHGQNQDNFNTKAKVLEYLGEK